MNQSLKNTINEWYKNTPAYVHQVYYDNKIVNGVKTDNKAIVFAVLKKKATSELLSTEVLPKTIVVDGVEYPTDVVQIESIAFPLSICGESSGPSSDAHRQKHRPLVGGISISNSSTSPSSAGTFGGIVKDLEDNNIVGLTNAHVLIADPIINSDKNPELLFEYNIKHRRVVQPGTLDGGSANGNGIIGYYKRYYPLSLNGLNKIDACLHSVGYVNKDESIKQLGLDNTSALPFATTSEIDSIVNSPKPKLIKSGRTTGYLDASCNIEAISTAHALTVGPYGLQNDESVSVDFGEIISFSFADDSNYVSSPGDSGSFVLCEFGGVLKIIGILFAGGPSAVGKTNNRAYACRIDNVASLLNISAWDGTSTKRFNSKSIWTYIETEGLSSDVTIVQDDKKYWQIGTKVTDGSLKNLYVNYGPIENEEDPPGTAISQYGAASLEFNCFSELDPATPPTPKSVCVKSKGIVEQISLGLFGWDVGAGRVASFGNVMGHEDLLDPTYKQLVHNTIKWLTKQIPNPNILVLTDPGTGSWTSPRPYMTTLVNALEEIGTVTVSSQQWFNFDGSELSSEFDLIIPGGAYNWHYQRTAMSVNGQQAIVDFVNNGGALLTQEWMYWMVAAYGGWSVLYSILPGVAVFPWTTILGISWARVTPNAIIDNGIPAVHTWKPADADGTITFLKHVKPGVTVFYDFVTTTRGSPSDATTCIRLETYRANPDNFILISGPYDNTYCSDMCETS